MKIYIAARWIDRKLMPEIAAQFEAKGYEITHRWWITEDIEDKARTPEFLKEMADLDYWGVMGAHAIVMISNGKSEGKAVEQGIALAYGKDIVAIGRRGEFSDNVFHYMDNYVWVDDIQAAISELDRMVEEDSEWVKLRGF